MRRLARRADGWFEIDAQAHLWARAVLAESFRWAELELLVYSRLASERRLVASVLASVPHVVPSARRGSLRGAGTQRSLRLIALLMGDDEPQVQAGLAWALRAWAPIDLEALVGFLRDQTAISIEHDDGHRARVIRDALPPLPEPIAQELRHRLREVRRRPGAPNSSEAARRAEAFAPLVALSDTTAARQGERFTRSRP
jgi:hypothetical protein